MVKLKQIISFRALLRAIPCCANFSTYTAADVMASHKSAQHDSPPFLQFKLPPYCHASVFRLLRSLQQVSALIAENGTYGTFSTM